MKIKLYHKWLMKVKSHIDKRHVNWAWCNRILYNEKLKLDKKLLISYALGIWHDHDNCCSGINSHIKKEVDDFKFKYRKYSMKYWTPEARMMRMLRGEDD